MADDINMSMRLLEQRLASLRGEREALMRIKLPPADDGDLEESTPFYNQESFLHRMLTLENEMRLSEATQELYREAEKSDDTDWLEVTDQLQRRLLKEQGEVREEELESALIAFRSAIYTYPALAEIPIYRRFQRARAGYLTTGDLFPDVTSLLTPEGSPTSLLSTFSSFGKDMPVMICTGSIS